MKFVEHDQENNEIGIIPEHPDDLYAIYNVIVPGDWVSSKTSRKLKKEEGGSDSGRTVVFLTVKVEDTDFHGFGDVIRVHGKITASSDSNVTMGSYHTIKVDLFNQINIKKKQGWAKYDLDSLEHAIVGSETGIMTVVMDDDQALISQVGTHATKLLLEMNPSIPRKSSDLKQHEEAVEGYFNDLRKFLNDRISELHITQIILGGPGFFKDNFMDYLKYQDPALFNSIKVVELKSPGQSGLKEIVASYLPEDDISSMNAQKQLLLIDRFFEELGKNTGKVAYGNQIEKSLQMGAIETLLIVDEHFRKSVKHRNQVLALIDRVKEIGGTCEIVSSLHESTKLLDAFNGIVAILRFPVSF